jgi:hypothetical protein
MLTAVRAVLDAGGALPLSAGVTNGRGFAGNFGHPRFRSYSVLGDCTNLAARLAAKAPDGELFATGKVLENAIGGFAASELPPFPVKGKRKPVEAFSVGHSTGARVRPAEDSSPIIGRESVLAALRAAARDAAAGNGKALKIVGPAGIGKSRLLAELQTGSEAVVVRADGDIYEGARPYAPFERVMRTHLNVADGGSEAMIAALRASAKAHAPHLEPWLPLIGIVAGVELPSTREVEQTDVALRKERLEELTSEWLGATLADPTLLIFNDIHLMDDASVDLITRLATDAPSRRWLLIMTRRPGQAGVVSPGLTSVTTIELEPLSAEAVDELLAQVTEAAPLPPHKLARLADRAAGNPLFLRELVARAGESGDLDELPDSVEGAITTRIDGLSPSHRLTLRCAAVLGMVVDVPLLAEVMGLEGPARDGLERSLDQVSEFLSPVAPDRRRFSQALVRDVAYEGLPYRRRSELHARTAEALERSGPEEADRQADLLSLHCLHGARFEAAWRYSRVAAERARGRYANAEAAESYRRALTAAARLEELSPGEVAQVSESLADAYYDLGAFHDAELSLRRASKEPNVTPVRLARRRMKIAKMRELSGQNAAALRWIARALEAVEGDDDPESRALMAQLIVRHARLRRNLGRNGDAFRLASQAITLAEASSQPRTLAEALEEADVAERAIGAVDARQRTESALAIYVEHNDLTGEARARNTLGLLAYLGGRWPEAVEHYRAGADADIRAGRRWHAAIPEANLAEILIDQGHLAEAERVLERCMRVGRAEGMPSETAFWETLLGRIAARRGRYDEARERLARAREHFAASGWSAYVMQVDALRAESLAVAGRYEAALALADAGLRQSSASGEASPMAPLLHRTRGIALFATGGRDQAEASLRESLSTARGLDARHEVAFALRELLRAGVAADADETAKWSAEYETLTIELGIAAQEDLGAPRPEDRAPRNDV